MRLSIHSLLIAAFSVAIPVIANACPTEEALARYLGDFNARRPNLEFSREFSVADAECARKMLIAQLPASVGPIIGYKAAFTSDPIRAIRMYERPEWGVMFATHLHASPARLPYQFGAVNYWEPDLIVEVKDAKLADAKTPLEALQSISAVIPFIHVKDMMTTDRTRQAQWIATNLAFRGGVLGQKIPVKASNQMVRAFAQMSVDVEQDGTLLNKVKGTDIMDGNPINAAIWLAQTLKKNGITLKRGDLLSLGELAGQNSTRQGALVKVTYHGLPGNPTVSVQFE